MDMRSLRFALTLAEELHFGRAADRHYIAAQPFGRRIQELEKELGFDLFERTSRRVTITPAGERFLPKARRALAQVDLLASDIEGDPSSPVLNIGVLGYGLADRWGVTLDVLNEYRPDLTINYVELSWEDQYDAVRTGEVDVAVVHNVGGADDLWLENTAENTADAGVVAAVPVNSDLADASHLTLDDLLGRPRLRLVGQPGLETWCGDGPTSEPHVRTPAALPFAVAMTGRFGIHGSPAARFFPHPGVAYIPLAGPSGRVAIASRRSDQRDSILAFRAAVQGSAVADRLVIDSSQEISFSLNTG